MAKEKEFLKILYVENRRFSLVQFAVKEKKQN